MKLYYMYMLNNSSNEEVKALINNNLGYQYFYWFGSALPNPLNLGRADLPER